MHRYSFAQACTAAVLIAAGLVGAVTGAIRFWAYDQAGDQ